MGVTDHVGTDHDLHQFLDFVFLSLICFYLNFLVEQITCSFFCSECFCQLSDSKVLCCLDRHFITPFWNYSGNLFWLLY